MIATALGLALALTVGPTTATGNAELKQRVEALVQAIEPQVADVPIILAEQLRRAQPRPLLLDVRSKAEREVSVIPGAIFDADSIPAGSRVVVYCTVGLRSGVAARELRQRGFDAVNLRGGILAWLAIGGELVDLKGQPTQAVHVYGRRWNAVPDNVQAVW
ncbi:MAG: rhodanese-like domain-containing protein [Lysobacterales bacterium]